MEHIMSCCVGCCRWNKHAVWRWTTTSAPVVAVVTGIATGHGIGDWWQLRLLPAIIISQSIAKVFHSYLRPLILKSMVDALHIMYCLYRFRQTSSSSRRRGLLRSHGLLLSLCWLSSIRVSNRVPWRKKNNSGATVANPTRPYWESFHYGIFHSCPPLDNGAFAFHVEGVQGCHWLHQSSYILDIISGCHEKPWWPWRTPLVLLNCTAEGTGLFFIH